MGGRQCRGGRFDAGSRRQTVVADGSNEVLSVDYSGAVIAFSQVRPCFADGLACRPGSVRRSVATIHLRVPLPTPSSGLPAHSGGPPSNVRASGASTGLLDLAPGGVYLAGRVTPVAGGLLHHRFTLTAGQARWRFVLCGTVPRVAPGGCYPPPCPVEPGPSSGSCLHAVARPAHPREQDRASQPTLRYLRCIVCRVTPSRVPISAQLRPW